MTVHGFKQFFFVWKTINCQVVFFNFPVEGIYLFQPCRFHLRPELGFKRFYIRKHLFPEMSSGTFSQTVYKTFDPFPDRKSTRLNSSHVKISYAVFCLKKKNNKYQT